MHHAIWINSSNELSVKEIKEKYIPLEAQTLVKVEYSGINPADLKHGEYMGILDCVAGYDFSGTVIEAGPGSQFPPGSKVAGLTPAMNPRPSKHGSHQDYMIAPDSMVFAVPPHLPMDIAATLGVAMRTAIDGVFCQLGVPDPDFGSASGGILIWGGASGVGTIAIQLAAAAGLSPILTTASSHNHEVLKKLGATHCFDYRDADVLDQIRDVAHQSGTTLKLAFDTIGYAGSAHMVDWCYSCCDEGARVVTTIPHPKALKCFATRADDITFDGPNGRVTYPARQEDAARTSKILKWAVENLRSLQVPTVRTVVGNDAAIEAIIQSAQGGVSFEKIVVKHTTLE
ncbi:hypothetical protein PENCOP_c003G04133 [Penicillium coprophilum]|uniref:Enoyl reductase (ER) domain-containing protein n=1 Tax=Penicillium coprophilum TaxID=36646 RepID=A0A1V6UZ36_9EURO|nr:hypothetical protein PENCOP_c003G04133 [Penicillium coprophilum]